MSRPLPVRDGGIPAIEVSLPGARVWFTGRAGGVSGGDYATLNVGLWTDDDPAAVAENHGRLAAATGRALAVGRQVHGTRVARVAVPAPDVVEGVDGHATTRDDVAATVLAADCLPVALAGTGAVAMLHAGWRGLADGVLDEGVRALRELGCVGELQAVIGPGAGACCYAVGADVARRFPGWAHAGGMLDLKGIAAERLAATGVAQVQDVGRCTICEPHTFFSHRASGGATGRQAGLIWRT